MTSLAPPGAPPRATLRRGGFTLIEVLAALVIVALGMLGAITAVNMATRNGTYLREKTLAHWIGMNVITERRLAQSPPEVTESNGDVESAGERWRWNMKVTQTAVETLRRMDVSVRLASAPEGTSLATVTGFYGTATGAAGAVSLDWSGASTAGDAEGEPEEDDAGDAENAKEGSLGERIRRQRRPPSDWKE